MKGREIDDKETRERQRDGKDRPIREGERERERETLENGPREGEGPVRERKTGRRGNDWVTET